MYFIIFIISDEEEKETAGKSATAAGERSRQPGRQTQERRRRIGGRDGEEEEIQKRTYIPQVKPTYLTSVAQVKLNEGSLNVLFASCKLHARYHAAMRESRSRSVYMCTALTIGWS